MAGSTARNWRRAWPLNRIVRLTPNLMNSSSFEPASTPAAKVLVLGTLPGQESLRRGEYYAHPRNAFWRIVETLFGIPADAEYSHRVRRLNMARVALWDVCAAAYRPGSLDVSISSESPNDFTKFLQTHREIKLIGFNGAKAAVLFRKHVSLATAIPSVDLPSTSPANAAIPFAEKVKRWSIIREACDT
jgi:TDG/mug DNA glycosylase family protein